ncbi:MAG: AAA family ATPase [Acidobacteriota bacterium]
MITRLKIENFKSLRDVEIRPGRVNIFFGPNGSGKSNLLDVLRVLKGFGLGMTVDQVFNQPSTQPAFGLWPGIRGGSSHAVFRGRAGSGNDRFRVSITCISDAAEYSYRATVSPDKNWFLAQSAEHESGKPGISYKLDESGHQRIHLIWPNDIGPFAEPVLPPDRPFFVNQLPQGIQELGESVRSSLDSIQMLDLVPFILRERSRSVRAKRLGPQGENLASVVKAIFEETDHKESVLAWLRELLEEPIEDLTPKQAEENEVYLRMRQFGHKFSASSLSDGTLRFIALVAAFFQPVPPGVLLIEEIENGIHPSRLRLVLELIKSQSERTGTQVFLTTHSPALLAWLREDDYAHTYFSRRDPETGGSEFTPLSEIPHFLDVVKKHSLLELATEGWFETV